MDNTASCMIEVCDLHKHYKDVHVLRGISTTVAKGEVCAVIGPSGSGKSTFLRCLNRLEEASSGEIFINAQEITDPHLNLNKMRENIGMVFQGFNLFPHMTAIQNIMLAPVNVRGLSHKEAEAYGMELLSRVGLADKHASYPDMLSGGQQQRVAIARALVNHPKVLLLDEPLGALDLKLRKDMQIELKRIQQSLDITFIYVTHDQEEALTMSDTVVVMNRGDIQQIGSPQDIYNEPNNAFVADFIGESNILDGVMLRDFRVEFAGQEFTCVDAGFGSREIVQVVVRPEDIQVVPAIQGQLTGLVENVIFKGVHYEMHVRQAGYEWIIHSTQASQVGELIGMNIGPDEIHIMHRTQG